ncbi:olfactory receptor 51E1-like [Salarias fasciatus]|uniref:Olfactory receptor n=1 Tax=Salarias fasciatus TaxID=181472 RepID=A0A672GUE7_SALFA|nr:olfactory receptor 51E1-like [Salarias fasciatus]
MDDKLNATYLTIGGYVEVNKYRFLYFFVTLALYTLIILSNSIILYLIWRHRSLHEPMYIFIAALSVNSLLFSTAIYPKFLFDFLCERQTISYQACLFQHFLFYTLGGADFLLLAAMAYDRYVSICNPLLYPMIMTKRTVTILLFLAWFLSGSQVAVSVVISSNQKLCHFTLRGIFCNNSVFKLTCQTSRVNSIYGIVVLINILVLPVLFILFTYTKILLITYRSSKDIRRKAAETCLPHVLVLISFSLLCVYNIIAARVDLNFPKVVHLIMSLQVVLYNPLLNPIIYGVKMKEINKHLRKLLGLVKESH